MTTALEQRRDSHRKLTGTLNDGRIIGQLMRLMDGQNEHDREQQARRFIAVYLDACISNPGLYECHPATIIKTVLSAAQLGLELGGPLGHAYPVPFKKKCELVVGYKGYCWMALRSGLVKEIRAKVVSRAEWDAGKFRVTMDDVEHEFDPDIGDIDEPDLYLAYCRVVLMTGGVAFEVLNREQVHKRRPAHWKSTPWKDFPDRMWRKSAIRALFSSGEVPLSPQLNEAMRLHDPTIMVSQPLAANEVDVEGLLLELGSEGGE